MPTYQWVSPTGHSDPLAAWINPARIYDGNWDTWGETNALNLNWGNFITLTLAGNMYIDKIRFKYTTYPVGNKKIDIDVYDLERGVWVDEVEEILDCIQHTAYIPTIYTDRIRVRVEGLCYIFLFEVDVEQVIPDTTPPPPTGEDPKNPPNPPEVYQTREQKQKGEPVFNLARETRVRTLHRTTQIKPWIV